MSNDGASRNGAVLRFDGPGTRRTWSPTGPLLMMPEVLYLPLMFLSGLQTIESAQVLPLACLWVYFTGIDPVLS